MRNLHNGLLFAGQHESMMVIMDMKMMTGGNSILGLDSPNH